MKTRHFLRAVAIATALAAAGPVLHAQTKEPVKASLRLKWLTQTQFAGFYYALAKGYYKNEGIDLTINPGGPNILAENMVATGADTFGLSGGSDSVLAGVDKGLPIVSICVARRWKRQKMQRRKKLDARGRRHSWMMCPLLRLCRMSRLHRPLSPQPCRPLLKKSQ